MKKILLGLFVIILIAGGIYSYFTFFTYQTKFMRGTTINNIDVSLLTKEEALEKIKEKGIDVNFTENKDTYSCNLSELATITYDINKINAVFDDSNNNKFLYKNSRNFTINPELEFDDEKIFEIVDKKIDRKESTNAEIIFNNNVFEIIPETFGNELIKKDIISEIKNKLANNEYNISINDDFYIKPTILAESLQERCDNYNKSIDFTITIKARSNEFEYISNEEIMSWLIPKGDFYEINADGTFKYDDFKIESFVDTLYDKYSTIGNSESFTTHAGNEIIVETSMYGWKVDKEGTVESIKEALNKHEDTEIELVYEQKAVEAENNIGNTYLEVSIPDQHWWYYKDGEVALESDCVTGLDSDPSRRTETGLTYIINMGQDVILKGSSWETHVDYWMAINYDGEGVHDASWRGSFGGDIYKYNGSHGCVNTPYDKVQELYGMITVGTPVIVY